VGRPCFLKRKRIREMASVKKGTRAVWRVLKKIPRLLRRGGKKEKVGETWEKNGMQRGIPTRSFRRRTVQNEGGGARSTKWERTTLRGERDGTRILLGQETKRMTLKKQDVFPNEETVGRQVEKKRKRGYWASPGPVGFLAIKGFK